MNDIINKLTVEEKIALVSGTDFMHTNPVPRLGIPSLCMADGPHGLRKQITGGDNGVSQSEPATSFPTAAATASSWNPENTRKMGEAIAKECRAYGVNVLLGPGVNIKRNPLCGRNFEYFSEDPFLASEMAIGEVQGVQSQGVAASVKHFALNNSENYRFMGNSVVSEKAMRAIYLKVFERIVKKAHPATLMCAYNQINGVFCSENRWLLTDVLRKEWGFNGLVMTDWGATHDREEGLKAGLDLEMPGDTAICRKWILDAINCGSLDMADLDRAVENVLDLVGKY
ncbi:MAG: glycoside hydrolase family 3 protein, partial [Clostridia bacterium]|nr:glycoside hydrolase family 3 protein [Clostridia bacterium]